MKLGIYGGTFSPVHIGHIHAANEFLQQLSLDKLMIIPANIPPHKSSAGILPPLERLELCRLAFGNSSIIEVSDIEIKREGASYTYDTLRSLHDMGYDDIYMLCGTDMLMSFDKWYRYKDIFRLAKLVLAMRFCPDADERTAVDEKISFFKSEFGAEIFELELEPTDISSTELRELIVRGEDVSDFLPQAEYEYIKRKSLYKNG